MRLPKSVPRWAARKKHSSGCREPTASALPRCLASTWIPPLLHYVQIRASKTWCGVWGIPANSNQSSAKLGKGRDRIWLLDGGQIHELPHSLLIRNSNILWLVSSCFGTNRGIVGTRQGSLAGSIARCHDHRDPQGHRSSKKHTVKPSGLLQHFVSTTRRVPHPRTGHRIQDDRTIRSYVGSRRTGSLGFHPPNCGSKRGHYGKRRCAWHTKRILRCRHDY